SFTFAAADLMNPNAVSAFLGSATGSGFLQSATNQLNGIEDPGTGLIPSEQMALQKQITSLTSQISAKQAEVNNLQIQLTSQMNTADASIASMEQQYNYVAGMFQAMQTAEQSYRSG
ncbi:MAG TPA: flagellar filament capping protein FliD, partial [Bryobacteraceae bacterium]|nr:flagellar filament capping protein FliD [Bryobacteraceae bacterium]